MILTLKRDTFTETTTLGKLYVDGQYFCETLEDKSRPHGVKVPGQTCIPPGRYNVEMTLSQRFGRVIPLIYNTRDKKIISEGVEFSGVRFHGGNTHKDTEGCPLVAFNRINDTTIQGSAEKALSALIKDAIEQGENVLLEITNKC